jgi:hypothetical protein
MEGTYPKQQDPEAHTETGSQKAKVPFGLESEYGQDDKDRCSDEDRFHDQISGSILFVHGGNRPDHVRHGEGKDPEQVKVGWIASLLWT